MTGTDGLTMTGTDGLTALGIQSVHVDTAGQVVVTKTDGTVFYAPTNGLTVTGANALAATGAEGIVMSGVQNFLLTGWDGLSSVESNPTVQQTGLESFDPELAVKLDRMTDDSNVNAVVVYHQTVTDSDIADLQAIGVHGGTRYLSPRVADAVIDDYPVDEKADLLERLSAREREVLQLLAEGRTGAEIAQRLSLSQKTVETYRARLVEKLGIRDVAGLVKFAIQRGLVSLD